MLLVPSIEQPGHHRLMILLALSRPSETVDFLQRRHALRARCQDARAPAGFRPSPGPLDEYRIRARLHLPSAGSISESEWLGTADAPTLVAAC
jgi:hypothetical protein